MTLDRTGIECLVPQRGTMCLLDAVMAWDATRIHCTAVAPGPKHPLAREHGVPAVVAIEYAAQATAVHGALLEAAATPRAGMLAKLSEVHLHTDWLWSDGVALDVRAERLGYSAAGCRYSFEVTCGQRSIADGRLMVAFISPGTP